MMAEGDMPENNKQKQSISQIALNKLLAPLEQPTRSRRALNKLLAPLEQPTSDAPPLSFAELLDSNGFDNNLSNRPINLINFDGRKIDFSGVDLSLSDIICDNREDLTFGDDSNNIARLNHTIIRTPNGKTHYLNSNDEGRIFEFVIDKPFRQYGLIKKHPLRLTNLGVCFGLVTEEARHNIKHNILSYSSKGEEKDFAKKLQRKGQDMSTNFANRVQYYQSNQDLRLPYERDLDIPYDSILNNIPGEMQDSKVLGISVAAWNPGTHDNGRHIISVSKIEREGDDNKYQIFDPNYGFSFCKTKEEVNKQLEAIIYLYQKSAPLGFDKKIKLTDLEQHVRESELLPLESLSAEENKNRKYKHSQRDYSESLIKAPGDAPIEHIKLLIEGGADIHAANKDGWTPLHSAAANGKKDVASLLLDRAAKVDAANNYGSTPLHIAAANGKKDVATLFLDRGANVNAANTDGETPLHSAVRNEKEEVATLLLDRGAKVDAANNYDDTPLHFAAAYGKKDAAILLLDRAAKVDAANNYGSTPLHIAAANGKEEIVTLLLDRGAKVDAANTADDTPLHSAAAYGKKDAATLLLDRAAKVDAANNYGSTPLHIAAAYGKEEIATLLLDRGAKVDAANKDGWTPLHFAAAYGKKDAATLLLDRAAKVDAQDKDGETPLHIAAERGKLDIVKLLLDRGAKVDAANKNDKTPLYLAVANGKAEVVNLLIKRGADVKAIDLNNVSSDIQALILDAQKNQAASKIQSVARSAAARKAVKALRENQLPSTPGQPAVTPPSPPPLTPKSEPRGR